MTSSWYEPIEDTRQEAFEAWCEEQGLEETDEARDEFESWAEEMREAAMERAAEERLEREADYDRD
jgi:hypothetical protein